MANQTSIESPLILVTLLSKRHWYHSWRPCPGQLCVGIHILIGSGKGEVSMNHTRENTDMPAIHNRSDIMEPMELVTAMLLRDARLSGNLFSNTRWMTAGRHVLEEVASRCLETPSLGLECSDPAGSQGQHKAHVFLCRRRAVECAFQGDA